MVQILDPRNLKRAAPAVAFALGAVIALIVAVLPQWRLETLISASHVGDLVSAARPPLGATARSALALASGGAVAAIVWAALTGASKLALGNEAPDRDVPVLRRADAHPDAPARRPLRASEDLIQPDSRPLPIRPAIAPKVAPETAIERTVTHTVPADLDTTLAAIDPLAIPDVPREPVRAVAPLAKRVQVVDDAAETFALTPIRRRPVAKPAVAIPIRERSTSLNALLDRLERGAALREARPVPPLEDALALLHGLAAR